MLRGLLGTLVPLGRLRLRATVAGVAVRTSKELQFIHWQGTSNLGVHRPHLPLSDELLKQLNHAGLKVLGLQITAFFDQCQAESSCDHRWGQTMKQHHKYYQQQLSEIVKDFVDESQGTVKTHESTGVVKSDMRLLTREDHSQASLAVIAALQQALDDVSQQLAGPNSSQLPG